MKFPIINSYGLSDIGTTRSNNEDIIASLPSHNFFAIADGMGGHNAGEIAAKEATDELLASVMEFLNPSNQIFFTSKQIIFYIHQAIAKANKKVFTLSQENISFRGMGTTLCCAYFHNNNVTYAHVGDSRVYLLRDDQIIQLTKDHSLISSLEESGQTTKNHPSYKNIITKAIGTNLKIEPSIQTEFFFPKDRFLMCTDGLSDYLTNENIFQIINTSDSNKIAVNNLIEAAKNNGSRDNISGLLIEIIDVK